MTTEDNNLTLEEWAGSQHLSLGLVFTDIVASTEIGIKRGDEKWIEDLFAHFSTGRKLAWLFDSYVVKVIGDSLMVAFRTASDAVSFAIMFAENTGVEHIGIRIGINSGDVEIRANDIYGLNVNFTSRVQHALSAEGILTTNSVKRDYEKRFGQGRDVRFVPWELDLKSFGKETVYLVRSRSLMREVRSQRTARRLILNPGEIPRLLN
jgi:class 3 adenylate cyclase